MDYRKRRERRSRTPPGGGNSEIPIAKPQPIERKPLQEMNAQERRDWYAGHQDELVEFCSYAQSWTKGRQQRGIYTLNDQRYEQFLNMAADLIAGLDELRQEAAQQADEHKGGMQP